MLKLKAYFKVQNMSIKKKYKTDKKKKYKLFDDFCYI